MLKTENRHFERSVRESLKIKQHRSAPKFGGMNQDDGHYMKTSFWMLFMDTIMKEERERENTSSQRHERETNREREQPDVMAIDLKSIP